MSYQKWYVKNLLTTILTPDLRVESWVFIVNITVQTKNELLLFNVTASIETWCFINDMDFDDENYQSRLMEK